MLDQLLKLVEESAQQPIVQNESIPNQFNNAAIREVTNQIFNTLKGQVTEGNMQQVITMFQTGTVRNATNPVLTAMISSVSSSLATKFSMSPLAAQSIANNLVPSVMNQVIKRSKDPHDIDFDLQQMMRGMSGNQSLDISSMMGSVPKSTIKNIADVFGKLFGK